MLFRRHNFCCVACFLIYIDNQWNRGGNYTALVKKVKKYFNFLFRTIPN